MKAFHEYFSMEKSKNKIKIDRFEGGNAKILFLEENINIIDSENMSLQDLIKQKEVQIKKIKNTFEKLQNNKKDLNGFIEKERVIIIF